MNYGEMEFIVYCYCLDLVFIDILINNNIVPCPVRVIKHIEGIINPDQKKTSDLNQ